MKKLFLIILLFLLLTANVAQTQSVKMFGQMLNLGHWSTDGLVFYWRGIEAGEAVDESFSKNHGTFAANAGSWAGGSYFFAGGTTGAAITPITIAEDLPWTMIFRVKKDSTGGATEGILCGDTGTTFDHVWMNGGTSLQVRCSNSTNTFTGPKDDFNSWHTYALVASGNDISLYIDGVLDETKAPATGNETALIVNHIGHGYTGTTLSFQGWMEHYSVYDRDLSASEIAELYINRDLPMQDEPIWLMFSPGEPPSGIVPIIQAHTRRRRAG